ncbi:MAG: hypothetical protein ABI237_03970 [Ginsengibacter sp.]
MMKIIDFFLERFDKYISPVADILAYNLLPNHFHFIIEVKTEDVILALYESKNKLNKQYEGWQHNFVMQQFSNFLNSYTKSFNKINDRKGSLFMDYIRRILIKDDSQLSSTIFYVHRNAVHHGYCKCITDWRWTSYKTFLSKSPTKVKRRQVLEFFGDEAEFVKFHSQPVYLKNAITLE